MNKNTKRTGTLCSIAFLEFLVVIDFSMKTRILSLRISINMQVMLEIFQLPITSCFILKKTVIANYQVLIIISRLNHSVRSVLSQNCVIVQRGTLSEGMTLNNIFRAISSRLMKLATIVQIKL